MDPSKNIVDFYLVPFYNLTYLTDDFLYKSWNNFTLISEQCCPVVMFKMIEKFSWLENNENKWGSRLKVN